MPNAVFALTDILTLDKAVLNGTCKTFAGLLLVAIVGSAVEETVALFDSIVYGLTTRLAPKSIARFKPFYRGAGLLSHLRSWVISGGTGYIYDGSTFQRPKLSEVSAYVQCLSRTLKVLRPTHPTRGICACL